MDLTKVKKDFIDDKLNNTVVTVLIASYRPDKDKLFKTVKSILMQKDIVFEIVIADDGSPIDYFEEIKQLFKKVGFSKYKLVKNLENIGTVKNLYSGIKVSNGQYIKLISPGDFLIGQDILNNWYLDTVNHASDLSFGDVIYYNFKNNNINIIKYKASPQLINVYHKKYKKIVENYILLDDTIHGASILCKRKLYEKYLSEAVDNVKYAEDCLYRLMIYDGIKITYFPKDVIMYEFGTGISTKPNDKWKALIKKDLRVTDKLLLKRINDRKLRQRFTLLIKARDEGGLKNKIKRYLSMPSIFFKKLVIKINKRYTNTEIPNDCLTWLRRENILR